MFVLVIVLLCVLLLALGIGYVMMRRGGIAGDWRDSRGILFSIQPVAGDEYGISVNGTRLGAFKLDGTRMIMMDQQRGGVSTSETGEWDGADTIAIKMHDSAGVERTAVTLKRV